MERNYSRKIVRSSSRWYKENTRVRANSLRKPGNKVAIEVKLVWTSCSYTAEAASASSAVRIENHKSYTPRAYKPSKVYLHKAKLSARNKLRHYID